jgi:glycosyltransferase involved in cell wall biosynthesis
MTLNPLVSVIVPCYKHSQFIERCLNSIAAQTYRQIEVIIVDDCSPDDSVEQIERVIQQPHWRERFVSRFYPFEQNQGAHAAINYGISQAKGEMITLLNSDDQYLPKRIERLVHQMQQQQAELAFSAVEYLDQADVNISVTHAMARQFAAMQARILAYPTVGFACLAANVAISTGNLILTRRLWEQVGLFQDYRYCHDWDFLLRCLRYTEPIFVNQPLYAYRFHGKNSFESLQSVAVTETKRIISSYLSAVRCEKTLNSLAPSSANWPVFFETFLHWHGFDRIAA